MSVTEVITIDGPAGSGKSTVAAALARRLGYAWLDTGAMYRAVTLAALEAAVDLEDEQALAECARGLRIDLRRQDGDNRVLLNGRDVTEAIRTSRVTAHAHYIARAPAVRALLVEQQRRLAGAAGPTVTEGRDQGSVVFPQARYKFYLDATPECRAQRRWRELREKDPDVLFEEVLADLHHRDRRDRERATAPLRVPDDAIVVDTTGLSVEEVVTRLGEFVQREDS